MVGAEDNSPDRVGRVVGRVAERAALASLLDRARQGRGGALVIVGEPGMGKTALLGEVQARARALGFTVLATACRPQVLIEPLTPLAQLFGSDALDVAPVGPRGLLEAGAPSERFRALEDRVLTLVDDATERSPAVLVIDDLQWADDATVRCVRALVDRASPRALAVVAASRPPRRDGAVGDAIAAWRRAVPPVVADLAPLTGADVEELSRRVLGSRPGQQVTDLLARAGGNPMVVLAVLEAVRSRVGGAAEPDGVGELGSIHPAQLFQQQVDDLDPDARRVVQLLAVLGPSASVGLLAAMVSRPVAEVLGALERAVAAGVVTAGAERFEFRHDLYREAVRSCLPADAWRALHREAAHRLANEHGDELEVAEHYLLGARVGDRAAVDWLHGTARRLCRRSPGTALRLVEAAVALDPDPGPALLQTKFEALSGCGRAAEAEALGRILIAQATDPGERARLHRELALALFVQGQPARAAEEMGAVSALLAGRPGWNRAVAEQAFTALLALDLPAATGLARQALGGEADPHATVAAEAVLTVAALFRAELDEAGRHATAMVRLADALGVSEAHQYQPWFCAGLLAAECDRLDELHHLVATGREVAVRTGSAWAVPAYDGLAAFAALRSGHLTDAAALAEAALGFTEEIDSFGIIMWCHAFLAQIGLAQGDLAAARHHTGAAEAILATGRTGLGLDHIAVCRSQLAELDGDLPAALAPLEQLWRAFTELSLVLPRQWMAPRLARLAVMVGRADLAEEAVAASDHAAQRAPLATIRADAALAAAWQSGDPAPALAAVELLAGTPRRFQRAEALHAAAMLVGRRGLAAEAAALGAAAAELFDAVGAPALAERARRAAGAARRPKRPVHGVDALTPSERAVVDLVAEGLGNQAIAQRLSLSRRTVESHVSAAYRKLGVSSRIELALAVRAARRNP